MNVHLCIPVLAYLRTDTSYNATIKDAMLVIDAQISETLTSWSCAAYANCWFASAELGLPNSPQDFMTFIHTGCLNLVKSCEILCLDCGWILDRADFASNSVQRRPTFSKSFGELLQKKLVGVLDFTAQYFCTQETAFQSCWGSDFLKI